MQYLKYIVPVALIVIVGIIVVSTPSFQRPSMIDGTDTTTNVPVIPTDTDDTTSTSGKFSASPISGIAPLTVTFSNMATAGPMTSDMYPKINYGDGTIEAAARCVEDSQVIADTCTEPGKNVHTYASSGTYTAKLIKGGNCDRQAPPYCPPPEVVGTATITVR